MSEATLPLIPEKVYFRIGEVADLVGVERYVLRYWESEFPQIAPSKSSSHHRMYRREDVDLFRSIKRLLYEEKFTIAGAKQRLMQQAPADLSNHPTEVPDPVPIPEAPMDHSLVMLQLQKELLDLLRWVEDLED